MRRCAVGREIQREDALGRLNWKSPCDRPIGNHGIYLVGVGDFDLCAPHAEVLLPLMAKTRADRLERERKAR